MVEDDCDNWYDEEARSITKCCGNYTDPDGTCRSCKRVICPRSNCCSTFIDNGICRDCKNPTMPKAPVGTFNLNRRLT